MTAPLQTISSEPSGYASTKQGKALAHRTTVPDVTVESRALARSTSDDVSFNASPGIPNAGRVNADIEQAVVAETSSGKCRGPDLQWDYRPRSHKASNRIAL
ncbi:hypothetical protein BN2476_680116 [Paraburkholderia piptadeniae]|uniref:Uncharacterized protein n=1 Tax=Paraburkholderia piptadeniae TaxID=1701573 RepID=A0A1N7SPY2_9BURK|nr:hypothetical protein BN2476_680116 [Paraburkholderia piptadeniae]